MRKRRLHVHIVKSQFMIALDTAINRERDGFVNNQPHQVARSEMSNSSVTVQEKYTHCLWERNVAVLMSHKL